MSEEENKVEEQEPEGTPKRVAKSKQAKVVFSPEEIETRYQAFRVKTRGGK